MQDAIYVNMKISIKWAEEAGKDIWNDWQTDVRTISWTKKRGQGVAKMAE